MKQVTSKPLCTVHVIINGSQHNQLWVHTIGENMRHELIFGDTSD